MHIRYHIASCIWGDVLIAYNTPQHHLCAVWLADTADLLHQQAPALWQYDTQHNELIPHILASINDTSVACDVPLHWQGTPLQQEVWRYLQSIKRGATVCYSDIARHLSRPNSARAIANACARNHFAIIVPCHRVIARNGNLAGYRWGIARKRALLHHEQT